MNAAQPPTREQIAEAQQALTELGDAIVLPDNQAGEDWLTERMGLVTDIFEAVLALFPQPTASAEHHDLCATRIPGMGIPGLEGVPQPCNCHLFAPEPVSIADMAPGTTFDVVPWGFIKAERFTRAEDHLVCEHGDRCAFDDVDPSTIRDVTPPPATPEETP